ncbi:hypothetical protein HMSSN036_73520 [Paenibacillus macerans]|nr:hypothetical protein HMSSN036_73520 [Paenibacillus macerans]
MRYIVTGVDGQLASRVAETVLAEADGRNLTFTCMKKDRIPKDTVQRWESAGVKIFEINYDDIPSMERAFKDGDRIYIVSGLEVGRRVQQHKMRLIRRSKQESPTSRIVHLSVRQILITLTFL